MIPWIEVKIMLKFGFFVGIPTIVTFLASVYSDFLENIVLIFVLSLVAMLVAILPQIHEKAKP